MQVSGGENDRIIRIVSLGVSWANAGPMLGNLGLSWAHVGSLAHGAPHSPPNDPTWAQLRPKLPNIGPALAQLTLMGPYFPSRDLLELHALANLLICCYVLR